MTFKRALQEAVESVLKAQGKMGDDEAYMAMLTFATESPGMSP